MSVIQSLQNLVFTSRIGRSQPATQALKPFLAVDQTASNDFRRARDHLLNLYRSLETLAELSDVSTRFKLDLPDARSSTGLGLDLTSTAATLTSTEEINASPRSFSVFGPDWTAGSDALITIGGVYDGTQGSGTLSFEVRRDGTHGVDDLRLRIGNPSGNVSNINIRANEAEDQQYSLNNGLYLTLGPGSLIDSDFTTIQVFDNVGAAVDPGKPLGGIRNNNPNLQFGSPSISDGAFLVNGQNISVSTSDSINNVIDRINASSAGVTATFNATTERMEFLQNSLGSVPTIELQGDTSNFLQATKLNAASVLAGIDPENAQAFGNVAAFASVQSGDIRINGQQIAIDTATDSLSTVIDKINLSAAGVTASFDTQTQQVLIEANESASILELDSNGTGLFAALNMPEGRVDPEAVSRGISRQRSYRIADAAAAAFLEISNLFRDASFVGRAANASGFRAPLETAIGALYGSNMSGDLFGLKFDSSVDARQSGDFATIDRRTLTRNLQLRGDSVQKVLGRNGEGLIQGLMRGALLALTNVNRELGISGTLVDTYA
ncbi:MAG: hypothetical protein OEY74_01870 [Gammaproteobacteria bacterium]|nr:hypothetical protein [Gammaproteobacteria bacterium]